MADVQLKYCKPQPKYVIKEEVASKINPLPSKHGVGPGLRGVQRTVLQVCAEEDLYYEGEKIDGAPTAWQLLNEYLRPGKQITSLPTGRRELLLVYAGFNNLLTPLPKLPGLPESWSKEYDLGTPVSPFVYGSDPIPLVRLFGNKDVEFIVAGGQGNPTAVAIYDAATKTLTVPPRSERLKMIQQILQNTKPVGSN